jgi:hypothetical protein
MLYGIYYLVYDTFNMPTGKEPVLPDPFLTLIGMPFSLPAGSK